MAVLFAARISADPRFAAGVCEFNDGNYFEAHEIWEDLWNDLVGQPKELCQGLIQIAAGYHKLQIGSVAGARKLLERGIATLTPFEPAEGALCEFVAASRRHLDALRRGTPRLGGNPPRIPT